MAAALNKRQQARNERTLQELIKTVPGNNVCADCGARNPGWASWSLGIFLCMRCAALHRKLGTHISKVKSLSMDKWDNAQVDNMRRIGNVESNKAYNPRNVKPQIPIDIDEVDSAMERFIRQKYQERAFLTDSGPGTRQNTGSTSSVEDRPPPLPPKPTRRFGFGLQKTAPSSRDTTPPISPGIGGFGLESSPPRVNKASRVFGSNVNTSSDGMESKLATLRDMGFPDDKRNATVLKGVNGNVDRAVETLIRLGEQNPGRSRGTTPTPTPPAKPDLNGLSFDNVQKTSSVNPFDALDAVAPPPQLHTQNLQYGGYAAQTTSPSNPYNPFLQQQQQSPSQQLYPQQQQQTYQNPFGQPQSLEQSFQSLNLSNQPQQQLQQQQPLFPNRTGGYAYPQHPQSQSTYPLPTSTNPFQQHSFTPPPMPHLPPQYASFQQPLQPQQPGISSASPSGYSVGGGGQGTLSPTATGSSGNPFLKSVRSQIFAPSAGVGMGGGGYNPFGSVQAQPQAQSPLAQEVGNPFGQVQALQQQQQGQMANPYLVQTQPQQQAPNPFLNTQQLQGQQQQSGYQQHQQPPQQLGYQSQQPQQNIKSSILALYNYPQLAPQRPLDQQQQQQGQNGTAAPGGTPNAANTASSSTAASGPSGTTAAATNNPFSASSIPTNTTSTPNNSSTATPLPPSVPQRQMAAVTSTSTNGYGHVSHESVDFAGLMGGRHSPDAFAGLSASFRR
ncbi:ArfGap-domain-containing protein [Westerdykella ornata]|uniref:ArfGap-domain-containing protein n=1 Tax=Westerdykella ornata TaxID=318751 RepID=A0A6A6JXJ4_WESOR|nr:ArfGap-domain-containing protein [Westerdykella ornata]KAF2280945.1 ArfGap-domain-containing protein [Westerdykella ornata]